MYCLSKKISLFLGSFLSFFIILISPSVVRAAYNAISFTPSSGTIYGDSTGISIYVDSGSDEYVGVDVNISYTGSVEYLTASQSKCSSFVVTNGSGTINVECLYLGDGSPYKGTVATLYFKATGSGTSDFSFSSTDPAVTTSSTATYILSVGETPTEGTTSSYTTSLPEAGILDGSNILILVGLTLLLMGVFLDKVIEGSLNLFYLYKSSFVKYSQWIQNYGRDKRRSRLEKRF